MRSRGEILQKIKQAKYRHLKRLLLASFPRGEDWDPQEVREKKEEIYALLNAPLPALAKSFPDVAALCWVVDPEDTSFVPGATLVGSMDGVLLWADTEEEASHARELLDSLAEVASQSKRSWWRSLFS